MVLLRVSLLRYRPTRLLTMHKRLSQRPYTCWTACLAATSAGQNSTAQDRSAENPYPHPVPLIWPVMRAPVMRPTILASPFRLVASKDPSGRTETKKVGDME